MVCFWDLERLAVENRLLEVGNVNRILSYIWPLLLVFAAFMLLKYSLLYLLPFIVALVLSAIINPLVDGIERGLRLPRGLVVAVVLVFVLGVISLLVVASLSKLTLEIASLARRLPAQTDELVNLIDDALVKANVFLENTSMPLSPDDLKRFIGDQLGSFYKGLQAGVNGLLGVFAQLPTFLLTLAVTCIATFFISRDRRQIRAFVRSLVPADMSSQYDAIERRVVHGSLGFIKAQFTMVMITAVISVSGLIVLGSPYALLLGLIAGILDIFPMLGPTVVFLPWILYSIATGETGFAAGLSVLFAVQTVIRQMMEPRIVGDRIGVHPLATLVSIYIGIKFFGAWGFAFGPLMAVMVKAVAESFMIPPGNGKAADG